MNAGLVSITFRNLSPETVIDLAVTSGLSCVEWGGDIHVPVGDLLRAREVGRKSREAGLRISSYGSYYWLDEDDPVLSSFSSVLDTAMELGAPNIRVWAGRTSPENCTPSGWEQVVDRAWRIAEMSAQAGLAISYEKHGGTLTETTDSCAELLCETYHPAIFTLWQPTSSVSLDESLVSLARITSRLRHLHVFYWEADRLPLEEGGKFWLPHLELLRKEQKQDLDLLLEYVPNNNPLILPREAATLRKWIAEVPNLALSH